MTQTGTVKAGSGLFQIAIMAYLWQMQARRSVDMEESLQHG